MGDLDKPLKGFGGAGVLEILEDDAVGGGLTGRCTRSGSRRQFLFWVSGFECVSGA